MPTPTARSSATMKASSSGLGGYPGQRQRLYLAGTASPHNLYQTTLTGTSAPWGVQAAFGMPIVIPCHGRLLQRERFAPGPHELLFGRSAVPRLGPALVPVLGRAELPVSPADRVRLLQGVMGRQVYNTGFGWAHLDFNSSDIDQSGRTVATPSARVLLPGRHAADNTGGIGGFYDILGPQQLLGDELELRQASRAVAVVQTSARSPASATGPRASRPQPVRSHELPAASIPKSALAVAWGTPRPINAVDAFTFPESADVHFRAVHELLDLRRHPAGASAPARIDGRVGGR